MTIYSATQQSSKSTSLSGLSIGGGNIIGTRAALSALSADIDASYYVEEVDAGYIYDAGSSATADEWTVLTSAAGGRFLLAGDSLTLPILGGASDDWPNMAAANAACAAAGVILKFGPGTYNAKTRQVVASKSHIVLNEKTVIHAAISPNIDNRDSVFCAYAAMLDSDALAADTNIGDTEVTIAGDMTLAVGDFIVLISRQFRCALYKVIAWNSGTKVVTLDRPIRLNYGSALATTSFPSGSLVWKVDPPQNVIIEFNGATIYGACNRFIEVFSGWKCNIFGPVHCGDGSTTTATERIISLDVPSYDCHAYYVTGDGGGVTTLGLSFETAESCSFNHCDMRNILNAGLIFQDGVDCTANDCHAHGSPAAGAIFSAAGVGSEPDSGSEWGSQGCRIVGGSYNDNYVGIEFEKGSSFCAVDGNTVVVGNSAIGVLDELGNYNSLGSGVVIRANSNGVYLDEGSVGFRSQAKITNCGNGVQAISGSSGSSFAPKPFGNTFNDVLGTLGKINVAGGVVVSNDGSIDTDTNALLTVTGNKSALLKLNTSSASGGGMMLLNNGAAYGFFGSAKWITGGALNDLVVNVASGQNIIFAINGSEAEVIEPTGKVRFTNTTDATTSTTGALMTAGGLGVAKTMHAANVVSDGTLRVGTAMKLNVPTTSVPALDVPTAISSGDFLPAQRWCYGSAGNYGGGSVWQRSAGDTTIISWGQWNPTNDRWEYPATSTYGVTQLTFNDMISGDIVFSNAPSAAVTAGNPITLTRRLNIAGKGNVVVGNGALSTTATDGFFYVPSGAGVPTGTPTAYTGRVPMYYDSTNNKFYIYNGAWKSVTLT